MGVKLTFNDVFGYIGDTGTYQILLYVMVCLPSFYNGMHNLSSNFFAAPMDHWCKVPRLENFSHEQQKYVAIPWEADDPSEYQKCQMYDLNYANLTDEQIWSWDRNTTNASLIECTSWVYDQSEFVSTIISKYDLVCDQDWMAELTSTLYMFGVLLGSILCGLIGDRFGRKNPMLVFMAGYFVFALLQAFSPNYTMFVVMRFMNAVCNKAAFICGYVILMEILGPRHYELFAACFHVFFSVGFMLVAGMAYYIRDHDKLLIAISVPIAATLPYIWAVCESPRWLISQGRHKEGEKIIKDIAEVNEQDFPQDVNWLKDTVKTEDGTETEVPKGRWRDLCGSRIICGELVLIFFNWFTVSLVYYGVSFNAGSFGDVFLNTFLSGLIEVPANLLSYISLQKVGRRWSNSGSLLVAAAFMFSMVPVLIVNPDLTDWLTALSTLGKGAITFSYSCVYIYTAELFPTPVRHLAVGAASMVARFGSMASPYLGSELEQFWVPMPSVIFGVITALAGCLLILLPETKNAKIPDTMVEAEEIGRARFRRKRKSKGEKELIVETDPEVPEFGEHNNVGYNAYDDSEKKHYPWEPVVPDDNWERELSTRL